MAIGSFGSVTFEYTTDKKYLFDGISGADKARWAKHDLLNVKPRSEFLGDGDSNLKVPILLKAINGLNPYNELLKLRKLKSTGAIESLIIGKNTLGKFYIESIDWSFDKVDNTGSIWDIKADLTINEYCDEEYVSKTTTSTTAVVTKSSTTKSTKSTSKKKKTTTKNTTKGKQTIKYEEKVKKKIGGNQ